jgi:mycoredoxin
MRRALVVIAGVVLGLALAPMHLGEAPGVAHASISLRTLTADRAVTVYGASWCSACKELEKGLRERDVPFDLIDVDQNPRAYDVARRETGKSVVPITSIARGPDAVTWIVGSDVDAVEKAYRAD